VLAAEINAINEKRTKTLAKIIVEISFIRSSPRARKTGLCDNGLSP
jgi:hypothetical protein